MTILYFNAKVTPKKIGQFVSVWKRDSNGITAPHSKQDVFSHFEINCNCKSGTGVFLFPKSALIKHGIISSKDSKGKRGFRVYPPWDKATNKQAIKTQQWQLNYFVQGTDE